MTPGILAARLLVLAMLLAVVLYIAMEMRHD
jgi:hypothetical protein